MAIKFLCFHTCKNKNTGEYILQNAPFHSDRTVAQWLGQGYYLWTDSDFFAHEWGKHPPRNNKYAIIKFDVILDNEHEILDLVGDVNDQLFFRDLVTQYRNSINDAIKTIQDKAERVKMRQKLSELCVSTVILFFQKRRVFPFKVVKAQDIIATQTNNLQFVVDDPKKSALFYPTRQQVVVYEHGKSVLKNPEIHHIQ